MKPKKPAATHAAQTGQCTGLEIKGSRLEDWIDKADLMQQFHLSARTVDNYIAKGILNYSNFGIRKYFYKPHILRYIEQAYR